MLVFCKKKKIQIQINMDHKTDPQVACSSKEKLDLIEAYRATYFVSANKQQLQDMMETYLEDL